MVHAFCGYSYFRVAYRAFTAAAAYGSERYRRRDFKRIGRNAFLCAAAHTGGEPTLNPLYNGCVGIKRNVKYGEYKIRGKR